MHPLFRFCLAGLIPLATPVLMSAAAYRITVASPDTARAAQVVSFALPAETAPPFVLRDAAGQAVPLQVDETRATFMVGALVPGTPLHFTLETAAPAAFTGNQVRTTANAQQLEMTVRGRTVLAYQMDKENLPRPDIGPNYKRAGYIHPVFSPAGVIVTGDYPRAHVHHHGIWSPWTRTRFQGRTPDFWNMNDRTGTVEFIALDATWSGPVHGGFVARHQMVDLSAPTPVPALNETWTVTLYDATTAPAPAHVFDLAMTQTCATTDPLELVEYRYGGLGFRGRDEWDGVPNTFWLTSEGETDRIKAHATRARWCHISGLIEGKRTGVAVLDHPSNFRHPQPMRVSPNEPFLSYTPPQLGDFKIEPGEPYVARYRFVVMDGDPDAALIDRFWNAFAAAPAVTMEVMR